ncbi:mCG146837 [Mus musculus]|nr:mCG146837 [Mus musculus]
MDLLSGWVWFYVHDYLLIISASIMQIVHIFCNLEEHEWDHSVYAELSF